MDYKIYNGDCLEIMQKLAEDDVRVDLVLTDPPYGTVNGLELDGWQDNNVGWDVALDMNKVYSYCNNLLREKGTLILFSQEPFTTDLRTNMHFNLPFTYSLIWLKDHFANSLSSKKAPVNYFEDINVFRKKYDSNSENPLRQYAQNLLKYIGMTYKEIEKLEGHQKLEHFFYRYSSLQFNLPTREMYDLLINKYNISEFEGFLTYDEMLDINSQKKAIFNLAPTQKFKSNVLEYKKDYTNLHPTQKPGALLEDLIKTYTNENDLVLDFTMGSGSTGVACQNTNRNFIGIELDKEYFKIAENRLEENSKQSKLTNFTNNQKTLV